MFQEVVGILLKLYCTLRTFSAEWQHFQQSTVSAEALYHKCVALLIEICVQYHNYVRIYLLWTNYFQQNGTQF